MVKNRVTSFFDYDIPPLTAMIQCPTIQEAAAKTDASLQDGAEAFGIQLCRLKREERTEENLKGLFARCQGKPIYITSYRLGENEGLTDEECADLLVKAVAWGANLADIPGDFFHAEKYQITDNEKAIAKQREYIDKIHNSGGSVLISTHDFRSLTEEEIFTVAKKQANHGADILKIVVKSDTIRRLPEYIRVVQRVNEELKKPFLFLDSGACSNILRKIGCNAGVCMYLCVQSHGPLDTPAQPTIKKLVALREAMEK